jgi:hypothetical protein
MTSYGRKITKPEPSYGRPDITGGMPVWPSGPGLRDLPQMFVFQYQSFLKY